MEQILADLTAAIQAQTEVLKNIGERLEADSKEKGNWSKVANSLDAFRHDIKDSQRRAAEALAIGRKNADMTVEAARHFRANLGRQNPENEPK